MNAPLSSQPHRKCGNHWLIVLGIVCFGLGAHAQSQDIHGRLEIQDAGDFSRAGSLNAAEGARSDNDAMANLRFTWDRSWGPWSVSAQAVLAVEAGPQVRLARANVALLPPPPATWFTLSETVLNDRQATASAYLDRLSLAYATPNLVVRIGRQALSWGSGMVFRPMDLFDPFSPAATDTEYKPGVDMIYAQQLFTDGSDLQFILAPRPSLPGAVPSVNDSSAALHFQTSLFGHRTTWLLARDRGDWVGAFGLNGPLRGATWNVEVIPTGLRTGGVRISALANISDALTLVGRNATVFAEIFHNGFGVTGKGLNLASLPPDLADRLSRGQIFDTRQNYLAGGVTVEASPLLTLNPTLIADLDDRSFFLLMSATLSLGDNLSLVAGLQAPLGAARTEFGGLPLTSQSTILSTPPARVYIQLRRYF